MSEKKTEQDENRNSKPTTPATRGNPDDPRWKAADELEKDNEEKLGEPSGSKHDKVGG